MWETIGSFIAGAADRLTGGWFSGPERDEQRSVRQGEIERQNYWNEQSQNQLQTNINIAKRNNIDPLAVLGSNVGSVATTPVQQPTTHHNNDFSALAQIMSTQIMADVEREKTKQMAELSKIKESQNTSAPQFTPNTIPLPPKLGVDQTGSTYLTFATLPDGGLVPVPSKAIKELIEDSPQELEHYVRITGHNYLGSKTFAPSDFYRFDYARNAWYPKDHNIFKEQTSVDNVNKYYSTNFRENKPKVDYPLGKSLPVSMFRPGLNPNQDFHYKKAGLWKLDKSGKFYRLVKRRGQ